MEWLNSAERCNICRLGGRLFNGWLNLKPKVRWVILLGKLSTGELK